MKNDVQKNWEKVYGKNPNPNKNYFYNDSGRLSKNSKLRNILRGIGIIVLLVLILFIKGKFKLYTTSAGTTKIGLTNNIITQSNKNGKAMNTSINKIKQMLANTSNMISSPDDNTINTLDDYRMQIYALDLSREYADFKGAILEKLLYGVEYIKARNANDKNANDKLEKYNSTEYIEELKKVFDNVGIKYTTGTTGIEYQYENK